MWSPDLHLGDLSAADRVQAGDPMIFVDPYILKLQRLKRRCGW